MTTQASLTNLMNGFRHRTAYFFLIFGAFCPIDSRAETQRPSPPIWFAYNTTLAIRENDGGALIVFSAMSDPVLYDSKCYVSVWQLDSIEQLNEYLEAQYVGGMSKPPVVLEAKSRLIVLDTSIASEFILSDKRYSWIPGGVRAGYLMLWSFGEQTKIGILDQSRIKPRFGEPDLLSIDAYIRRSKKIQRETEKEHLEKTN